MQRKVPKKWIVIWMLFKEFLKIKGGNEKVADVANTFHALEQHRNLIDCVHDTVDGIFFLVSSVTVTANYSNCLMVGIDCASKRK